MSIKHHDFQATRWLDELQDPFALFPIQSVGESLDNLIADADVEFAARQGPDGVARKFWDVPSELLHEEIGLLIGAAFVLGQATLTQTISILNRLRQVVGPIGQLPLQRRELLNSHTKQFTKAGFSHLVVIDLAANYFKHHHEWPDDRCSLQAKHSQSKTMEDCKRLGMAPGDSTSNLHSALSAIGAYRSDVKQIQLCIQTWREQLADQLYCSLGIPNPAL